jgi:hypothetical protein
MANGLPSERHSRGGPLPGGALSLARQRRKAHDGEHGGDETEQDHGAEGRPVERGSRRPNRPDYAQCDGHSEGGARGVRCAVETEREAALVLGDGIRHQGVSRRGAYPLAHAVRPARAGERRPGARDVEERFRDGGDRVPRDGDPLAVPHPVGEAAGEHLETAGDALRSAFDQADGGGGAPQDVREEERDEMHHHLARDVHQKACDARRPDVSREAANALQSSPPDCSGAADANRIHVCEHTSKDKRAAYAGGGDPVPGETYRYP